MRRINPKTEERQTRVFDLSVQGFSNSQIATLLKVHRETVQLDIATESARRAAERSSDRAQLIEKNVAHYERIVSESTMRVSNILAAANSEADGHIAASLRAIVPAEIRQQLKAREQAAKTLGLYAPLSVDVTTTLEVEVLRAKLRASENRERFHERQRILSGSDGSEQQ